MFDARPLPDSSARILWPAFFAAVLAAWGALFLMARAQALPDGVPRDIWASLCIAAGQASLPALWAMWGLMAAAMMLPTFAPALRTYRRLPGTGTGAVAALVAGYLAVWLLASGAGAAAQAALSRAALVAPDGASLSRGLTAGLLIVAGAWQFAPLKSACLTRCRHPLTYFLERWQPGPARAFRMGAGIGAHCLGCCWALMATGFVGGTMNLLWMGAATAFMAAEKLALGQGLTRPAGVALIAAGGAVALGLA
jgi:predicted metal-binding membrane protein